MPSSLRAVAIRRSDSLAEEFATATRATTVLGASLAATEVASLHELAAALISDVARWRGLLSPLDVAVTGRFEDRRACALVLETVFDDVLSPAAWRVLRSAVEVSASPERSRSSR